MSRAADPSPGSAPSVAPPRDHRTPRREYNGIIQPAVALCQWSAPIGGHDPRKTTACCVRYVSCGSRQGGTCGSRQGGTCPSGPKVRAFENVKLRKTIVGLSRFCWPSPSDRTRREYTRPIDKAAPGKHFSRICCNARVAAELYFIPCPASSAPNCLTAQTVVHDRWRAPPSFRCSERNCRPTYLS